MANLLYLVHRLPYPPNKGDKVRSYHLLKHLVRQHKVFLGTFIDDPADREHLPRLQGLCSDVFAVDLDPKWGKLRSLTGLATGEALTLRYYNHAGMRDWVRKTLASQAIDASLVFSSSMGPYAQVPGAPPMLVDMVDVDSAKWAQYAANHPWPVSWLYKREGERLLAYERQLVQQADASFLVTDNEVALFKQLAPESAGRVSALCNGVDAEYFDPALTTDNPFKPDEMPVVFTGAMDYWPNVDAVQWFANEMLPKLRQRWPAVRFYIVGRAPAPAVSALAGEHVVVTGSVPDVRPYLRHAHVVVAPLRLARGVQNKVLEAMAMGQPVVAAASCVQAIDAQHGQCIAAAEQTDDYVREVDALLANAARARSMGAQARDFVVRQFDWTARMSGIDQALAQVIGRTHNSQGAPR